MMHLFGAILQSRIEYLFETKSFKVYLIIFMKFKSKMNNQKMFQIQSSQYVILKIPNYQR